MKLTRLFTPIKIGNMELKNRVLMPPIHHLYTPDGYATERFNQYYWRRAEGGAGLIMVGGCRFDDYGGSVAMMSLRSDEFIPGYKEFTDGMHARGTKVGVQLYHAGRYAHQAGNDGKEALAPSAVYSKFTRETPREMTVEELKQIIRDWAAGAARAKAAGFDTVEIVGSAGYLITQFLSPLTNQRSDEYGGTWENRTRFAKEVVAAVRAAVGADYPLCMRIAGNDFMKNSNNNKDAVAFCQLMEQAGIDMFNITGGWHETVVPQLSGDLPRGGFTYLAAAIKDAVSVPVAVSNRINDPVLAERILALDEADLVSVGRPMIADPDWVNKAKDQRFGEIRRCVACNQGCLAKTFFFKPVECLVNGMAGKEYLYQETARPEPMKLLVVGAGPAGCEFAVQAAAQGHDVTLWEKGRAVGGQLYLVAAAPGKEEFHSLIRYYEVMLEKNGVKIVFNKEATSQNIAAEAFDAVVTATGIIPNRIPLPDTFDIPVYTAYDVLSGDVIVGKDVVIVGGGAVGCETAQYLAREASLSPEQVYFMLEHQSESVDNVLKLMNESRRHISVVDIIKIGAGFEPGTSWPVLKDMARLGVRQYPFAKVKSVAADSITVEAADEHIIPCDTIVLAVGAKSNSTLYQQLKDSGVNVYNLGDSQKVGKVLDAICAATELTAVLGQKEVSV